MALLGRQLEAAFSVVEFAGYRAWLEPDTRRLSAVFVSTGMQAYDREQKRILARDWRWDLAAGQAETARLLAAAAVEDVAEREGQAG